MKRIIAGTLFSLAAAQANAAGFYQMVSASRPASEPGIAVPDNRLAPLHQQVLDRSREIAQNEIRTGDTPWSLTPLYRQVVGAVLPSGAQVLAGEFRSIGGR